MRSRTLGAGLVLGLTASMLGSGVASAVETAPAGVDVVYEKPLRTAAREIGLLAEHATGYDRDLFIHWIDADGDGCDTREEVLISESTVAATIGAGCTVTKGSWKS